MDTIPQDIKPGWFSLIRRLQSVSKTGTLSVIKVAFLVDENGEPLAWTTPNTTRIEPKSDAKAIFFELADNSNM